MTFHVHLAGVVGAGAAACGAAAWAAARRFGPRSLVAISLSQATAVGVAVALAATDTLAASSTSLMGKDPKTGALAPWSLVLLWPYHVALRVKLGMQRARRYEDLYNEVVPGWFLGGWPASAASLPPSVGAVVDVTAELPRTHERTYYCAPVWDTHAPSTAALDAALAWAATQRAAGHAVYVHCAHGHGRSAAVLVAALLDAGVAADADAALALVQAARPRARLNHRQRASVDAWCAARRKRG